MQMKTKILTLSALALIGISSLVLGASRVSAQTATSPTPGAQTVTAPTTTVAEASETPGQESAAEAENPTGVDPDGPGGHQDPDGVDVQGQGGV